MSKLHSDHRPILLRCAGFVPPKNERPFRFQAAWLRHKEFSSVVQNAWGKGDHSVVHGLHHVKEDATDFNTRIFGNIFRKKRSLEGRLKDVQKRLEICDSIRLSMIEAEIWKEFNDVLKQEEILWYQKSREKWVRLGDRNTHFFHTQTVVRRKRNKVQGLYLSNGNWCIEDNLLKAEAISFFKILFMADANTNHTSLHSHLVPQLGEVGSGALMAPVSKEEVRAVVFSMKSYMAPGPDGFQPIFFKHFWRVVGDDLWNLVCNAFLTGHFEECLAETLIMLIPKVDNPMHLRNFRPISLCNVVYRVITKVLVSRLRPFLDDLIGPLQSSFLPKKGTSDNAILAQEVIHFMHTSKSKKGIVAFKIDLEKAYDRVSWDFLETTLRDFGFPLVL